MAAPRTPAAAPSPFAVVPGTVDRNRRAAVALVAAAGLAPGLAVWIVVGLLWSLLIALAPAVVICAGASALLWRAGPGAVVTRLERASRTAGSQARLQNLVESVCAAAGVVRPAILVVDSPAPNVMSVGHNPRHATLIVTTGLVDKLTRVELEGVLAHEITHVRRGDVAVTAAAAVTVAPLARIAPRLALRVWRRVTGRREVLADVGAVGLTRYPPGLLGGLEKMRDDPAMPPPVPAVVDLAWAVPVRRGGDEGSLTDPMDERLQALREL